MFRMFFPHMLSLTINNFRPGVLQSPLRLEISVHANFKDSEVCCARAHGSGMVIDLKTTVLFMPT